MAWYLKIQTSDDLIYEKVTELPEDFDQMLSSFSTSLYKGDDKSDMFIN